MRPKWDVATTSHAGWDVSKSLDEIGGAWYQSDTHKLVNELKKKVTDDNITLSTKFGLEVQNDFETLSIIH